MNKAEYETKLKEIYNGAVKPLNTYLNEHSSMLFHCDKCGVDFFGKAGHMVGKKHYRHACGMPYGNLFGERLLNVGGRHTKRKTSNAKIDLELFKNLVWDDYTPQQVAQKLKVNPNIIIDYFKKEGLI